MHHWDDLFNQELRNRESATTRREIISTKPLDSTHVEIDGRRYVNFASNNYLGLTHHPKLIASVEASINAEGFGSGASPLITGHTTEHRNAEIALATWKKTDAAVLLPSGYQASHAIIQTLLNATKLQEISICFYLDKLVHASLVDAVVNSSASFRVYGHNQLAKLRRLFADAPRDQFRVVVTESIFSMDGDACDLAGLAKLKSEHPFFLVLDEAHASGVYGNCGAGYSAEIGYHDLPDATMITLSKAFGGAGGAICGSRMLCDAVANFGRAYIYSTSLPACQAAAAITALEIMHDEPWRQTRVRELARRVRANLHSAGVKLPPGDSPIIPIILGSEKKALQMTDQLKLRGILSLAIRPPTVARGTSRLRITLSCDHTEDEVALLLKLLAELTI